MLAPKQYGVAKELRETARFRLDALLEQSKRMAASRNKSAGSEAVSHVKAAIKEITESIEPMNLRGAGARQASKLLPKLLDEIAQQIYQQQYSAATYSEMMQLQQDLGLADKKAEIQLADSLQSLYMAIPRFQTALLKEMSEKEQQEKQDRHYGELQRLISARGNSGGNGGGQTGYNQPMAKTGGRGGSAGHSGGQYAASTSAGTAEDQWRRGGCGTWNGESCSRLSTSNYCPFNLCHEPGKIGREYVRRNPATAFSKGAVLKNA